MARSSLQIRKAIRDGANETALRRSYDRRQGFRESRTSLQVHKAIGVALIAALVGSDL